jgi:D-galactarolactone cycloisomerase
MWTASCASPSSLDSEGYLAIPDTPGLGMALDPEKVARYTPDARLLFQA